MIFNPSIALIGTLLFSLSVSFSNFYFAFLMPIIFLMLLNIKHLCKILKKLLFLNLFIFTIFIFVWIQATLTEALNIYLRTNIIIFFNLMLFYHSKGLDIVRAFFMLKFPKRFIATFYFTWKMIIELQNEFKKIKTTLVTRNFHSKTNLFSYQTYGNILGLLFIKSIQKSQQQKEIFLLRGFDGEIYLQTQFKVCSFDWYLMALILATLLLRIFL